MATPAFCSIVIDFGSTGSPTPGTVTTTTGGVLTGSTAINAVPFNELTISGASQDNGFFTITNGSVTYNASTSQLLLTGEVTGIGINTVTTLLSATITPAQMGVTLSNSNQNVLVAFNTATNLSEAAILTALGLAPAANPVALTSGSVQGSGSGTASGGNYTFSSFSETLDTTVTPEPVSFLLMGGGLLLFGGLKRKQ
jgi:hypothetical protein